MSAAEMEIAKSLFRAVNALPERMQGWVLGYAERMVDEAVEDEKKKKGDEGTQ